MWIQRSLGMDMSKLLLFRGFWHCLGTPITGECCPVAELTLSTDCTLSPLCSTFFQHWNCVLSQSHHEAPACCPSPPAPPDNTGSQTKACR